MDGRHRSLHTHASCGVGALVDLKGRQEHALVSDGLQLLLHLDHRGARGAEEDTGDGAGILLQKPHSLFAGEVQGLGGFDDYGVGQFFLPQNEELRRQLVELVSRCAEAEGFETPVWRDVPTDNTSLGRTALESEPVTRQAFFKSVKPLPPEALDLKLYVLRHIIQNESHWAGLHGEGRELFYPCSLDRRKIVYKGLLTCAQLGSYYPDLSDERVRSALVLVHARFSTNTLGAWNLAHPYHSLIHNGEFNTLQGNRNWMRAREASLAHPKLGDGIEKLKPLIPHRIVSDSAEFDDVLELLIETGRSLPHALRMLIPEAWEQDPHMDPVRRDFYAYHANMMEPWDGPALVVASDGYQVAAVLDRNGFRPCRYSVTRDNRLILASETGVLDTPASEIVSTNRLKPGELLVADTRDGGLIPEEQVFEKLAGRRPYAEWLAGNQLQLDRLPHPQSQTQSGEAQNPASDEEISRLQRVYGYTIESLRVLLAPMAETGADPKGAMGNDAPLAALSAQRRPLSHYFLQQFAQVSNPPLDYIRESLVTSLGGFIGRQRNLLDETPQHCRRIRIDSPVLTAGQAAALRQLDHKGVRACVIDITYMPGTGLPAALDRIRENALQAIQQGCEVLVLSDRGAGKDCIPVPGLLAVAAVHHHLVSAGQRTGAGLVLETGEPHTVHQFCTLIGYGADAVHPWLAYASVRKLIDEGLLEGDADEVLASYRHAVEDGILKVMSKMGISTLEGYKGAQIFESLGLDQDLVDECFTGTVAHVPGIGLELIERELEESHHIAYSETISGNLVLPQGGELYWRRDGEIHQWNPWTIGKLQHAARFNDTDSYRAFAGYLNEQAGRLQTLGGLLEFVTGAEQAVPLGEVEPVESIMQRFSTGSMSFGALSREAHEAMAIAMNRIGGKAGSGEGGEQVDRFGTERENSMKQVASGRFGVTIHYLTCARQLEIKMAQGSKPGEGGELPGGKVDREIAEVRFTVPGVGLISPPPHHDIYSIEDLAQLIHDLKCANPEAEVHVKLVAKANVGTIAAGVAKARADAVLISGDSGGTGASKKTSIKHGGTPWELGIAETHRVLVDNNLRSRITVRADGGFKTGRDVALAALLGAEEYGFGTAPLVVCGCIMLRKCHCNTCSVGVATQDPELRKRFTGQPEHVINYFRFVAQELREYMAAMGFRRVEEMIGRVDRLRAREITHPKAVKLDVSGLLAATRGDDTPYKVTGQDHKLAEKRDHQLIEAAMPALEHGEAVEVEMPITNRDRTFGTLLSSAVAKRYGADMLPEDTIRVHLAGAAGQSFGAFLARGISMHLAGAANDYCGKGLSGGKLSLRRPDDAAYPAAGNVIVGNVALYGATSGEAYFNGMAGERFCVRNSGVLAVAEGVGDHGCEYMTGGVAVILGPIGKNFGAGMSGGEGYIYDEQGDFRKRVNPERVTLESVSEERDIELLHRLIENHRAYTGSEKAVEILDDWEAALPRFIKVVPEAYAEVVRRYLDEGRDIRVRPPAPARLRRVA